MAEQGFLKQDMESRATEGSAEQGGKAAGLQVMVRLCAETCLLCAGLI